MEKRNPETRKEAREEAYKYMLQGFSRVQILPKIMEEFGYNENQAKDIVSEMKQSLISIEDEEEKRGEMHEMYLDLYRTAIVEGDIKTAKNILDSLTKLEGLLVHKVNTNVETIKVNFE